MNENHAEARSNRAAEAQPTRLLTKKDLCARLDASERTVDELIAAGVIGPALELGPRMQRWTEADWEETLARLPRRARLAEPENLANGRRRRIEAMKAGASSNQSTD